MKKTYITPKTELAFCEIFQILQGTAQTTINPQGSDPLTEGGAGGDGEIDFTNRTNLWDED